MRFYRVKSRYEPFVAQACVKRLGDGADSLKIFSTNKVSHLKFSLHVLSKESDMPPKKIVRVVAKLSAGDSTAGNYRFIAVCGIDENNNVAAGDWTGFTHNNEVYWPFILRLNPEPFLFFGGDDKYCERTTFLDGPTIPGRQFSISNGPSDIETWTSEYEITSA